MVGFLPLICFFDIEDALADCDVFMAIGTSGQVYPANRFVNTAKANGAHTIEFNIAPPSGPFAQHIAGKVTQTLPAFLAQLGIQAA